jgi:hypothetical protein
LTRLWRPPMLGQVSIMFPTLRTRIFAAALLVPLLALALQTSGVGLRCRLTGVVLDACCCGEMVEAAEANAVASVSAAQCCDRVVRDAVHAPAELSAKLVPLSAPAPALIVAIFGSPPLGLVASPVVARADFKGGVGPPTVRLRLVAKSSFLI